MFDIDKYLSDIAVKEIPLSDELVERTLLRCEKAIRIGSKNAEAKVITESRTAAVRGKKEVIMRKAALIALPAVAVLIVGIIIGANFFGTRSTANLVASAYYTVDINPSVRIGVDDNDVVMDVLGQNDDAEQLLKSLDCTGEPVQSAIGTIIQAAQDAGYLDGEDKYVLVGCFGRNETTLSGLQSSLEQNFGDMVDLLIVSGSLEDMQEADALRVSAGLLKLSQMAQGVEVNEQDKLADVVDAVTEVIKVNCVAPQVSASANGQNIRLSWSEMDFVSMGYTGPVTYRIVYGDTKAQVTGKNANTLGSLTFFSYGDQALSYTVSPSESGIEPGVGKYYGIYAEFGNGTVAVSNAAFCIMPGEAAPTPTEQQPEPSPDQTLKPEPPPTATASASYTVSGHVSGQYVKLSWSKETSADFTGYKVVASKTNENPRYPDDGYLKYITNKDTTSISLYEGYGGLKADQYYYFSVTYLYKDGRTVAGNAVRLKVPLKEKETEEPTPEPTTPAGDYVSTNISGSISESTVSLSWGKVNHSAFEGYKVMYSFSDSSPVYGDGSNYAQYITNAGTTSCSLNAKSLSGYAPGATCYFSITVLYDDHNVKKAGNTIALQMPEEEVPEEPYVSSSISGGLSGTTMSLNWEQVTHSQFDGYKVMYSFTDSSPVYGDGSNYIAYITDATDTGCSADITSLSGYAPGATCYFSITVLYDGHNVKKAGNTISVTAP